MEETEFEKLDKQVPFLFFSTIVTSAESELLYRGATWNSVLLFLEKAATSAVRVSNPARQFTYSLRSLESQVSKLLKCFLRV